MALSLIAYPKIIYIQSAEPSNKTQGLLWIDTDDNKLYTADGSSYNVVGAVAQINKISDDIVLSHDAVAQSADTFDYNKLKTITLNLPLGTATLRVKFDAKDSVGGADGLARLYKNGVAVGTVREVIATYTTYSEDLEFADGDTLELWAAKEVGHASRPFVKNLRVCSYGVLDASMSGANSTP